MTGIGAFSFGWNLLSRQPKEPSSADNIGWGSKHQNSLIAGGASTFALLLLGNLGTVRMIWQGLMRLAPNVNLDGATFIDRIRWTFQGLAVFISGTSLPFGRGDWYWIPSRVYPNEPITEFPLFTFLYADMHAHLIALPITLLILGCCYAFIRGKISV